jgi:rhodanese-related sulfurtransferase
MNTISIVELYEHVKNNNENIILINVLSKSEFKDCHIPCSIHIPLDQLTLKLHNIDKSKKIIVYCSHEFSSASETAYKILKKAGFPDVYEYKGGMREWIQSDLKTLGNCEARYLHELDQKR